MRIFEITEDKPTSPFDNVDADTMKKLYSLRIAMMPISDQDWSDVIDRTLEKAGYTYIDDTFVKENFADGKVKGKSRPGRVKKSGASCNGSVTDLRAKAKKASGERAKMYHWCANMKSGKKKK